MIWLWALAAAPQLGVLAPVDPQVLARVDGQLSDLDWQVEQVVVPQGPALQRIRAAAARSSAQVFAFFEAGPTGWDLYLARRDGEKLLAQQVSGTDSEALETVAILVRSTLESFEQGAQIAVPLPTPLWFSLGPLGRHDGLRGQLGASLAVSLERGPWWYSLELQSSLPFSKQDPQVRLQFWRGQNTLAMGYQGGDTVRYGIGVRAGVAVYRRTTTSLGAAEASGPAWWVSPVIGPVAKVGLESGLWGLYLNLGADLLGAAPRFEYRSSEQTFPVGSTWRVQPFVGLSGQWRGFW